ncbi:MAG TPA: amidohydrolase family protein [Solirubrobacteraceae bacterium]|nr:amidohydrolase family protein [Solirubrobacteraceae bacterium]
MTSPLIDCDVHNVVGSIETLTPYLSDHWREVIATSQFAGPTDQAHPPNLATSRRHDLNGVGDEAPGRGLATVRAQLLDPLGLEYAILSCDYGVESVRNPDAASALAAAVNDWQIECWLEPEPRLRAGIVVASQQPGAAVAEIERVAAHPQFVAVYLPVRSAIPYGNRIWWPVLEAASAHGLVVELHFGGSSGVPPTASGWPTSWLEEYVDMASAFSAQLTSLIAEGAFDHLPELRVSLIESGFAWLPAFLWRFDKGWRGLRREIPWTRRRPSEYVGEHVRVALQPVDGPPGSDKLLRVIEQLPSEDLLMFASDYPHRHSSDELAAIPSGLPESLEEGLRAGNARAHYRL